MIYKKTTPARLEAGTHQSLFFSLADVSTSPLALFLAPPVLDTR